MPGVTVIMVAQLETTLTTQSPRVSRHLLAAQSPFLLLEPSMHSATTFCIEGNNE